MQGLPAFPPMADKIDLTERFNFMDSLQMVRRGGVKSLEGLAGGGTSAGPGWFDRAAMWMIDWRPATRTGTLWYDRMTEAARLPDREQRVRALRGTSTARS